MKINKFKVAYIRLHRDNDQLFDAVMELSGNKGDVKKCLVTRKEIDEAIISAESAFLVVYLKSITRKLDDFTGDIIFIK